MSSKLQEPMEHSGAISCSLKVDMDEAANSLVSCTGHWKPNEENTDTTCAGMGQAGRCASRLEVPISNLFARTASVQQCERWARHT